MREYVHSQLEKMPGNHGEYLIGGVTISALQPMRPLPFEIVYILGLGESLFPGSNSLSSFDLRGVERMPGDIRPAEARQYDFLATVLSAQRKLYLLYNSRDLQKDQELLPAVPLQQLQRSLGLHVLNEDFHPIAMPMQPDDPRFIDPARQPAYQDVLVQPHALERCLSVLAAKRENQLALTKKQEAEWERTWAKFQKEFTIADGGARLSSLAEAPTGASARLESLAPRIATVSIGELRRFLRLPAQASLRRHLYVDEDEERSAEDDEPLVTPQRIANALYRQAIQRLVLDAADGKLDAALAAWPERFRQAYADARLCSRVPEEAFGEIDQAALLSDLGERINGQGQIEAFLREHAGMEICGPVLLGESLTPIGPKLRFPALRLRPGIRAGRRITTGNPPVRLDAVCLAGPRPLRDFDGYQHQGDRRPNGVRGDVRADASLSGALGRQRAEHRRDHLAKLARRARIRAPHRPSRRHAALDLPGRRHYRR